MEKDQAQVDINLHFKGEQVYPNKALEKAKLKAVEIAKSQYINHDISHCNIEEMQLKCTTCRRYIAHLQISEQYEKFKDGLLKVN